MFGASLRTDNAQLRSFAIDTCRLFLGYNRVARFRWPERFHAANEVLVWCVHGEGNGDRSECLEPGRATKRKGRHVVTITSNAQSDESVDSLIVYGLSNYDIVVTGKPALERASSYRG